MTAALATGQRKKKKKKKRLYSFRFLHSYFSRIGNEEFSPDESCTTVGALDARPDPSLSELSSSLSHVDLFRRGHRATSSSSSTTHTSNQTFFFFFLPFFPPSLLNRYSTQYGFNVGLVDCFFLLLYIFRLWILPFLDHLIFYHSSIPHFSTPLCVCASSAGWMAYYAPSTI